MTITVTPIPQLVELAAPAFTLGTANAAGSAATAVASDSTLAAFTTTVPTDINSAGESAATGDNAFSSREDHVHGSTAISAAATEAEMEAASSTSTYASPGRTQYHPAVAKGSVNINSAGTATTGTPYNWTSTTDTGTGNRTIVWDTDFSAQAQQGSLSTINLNGVAGYSVVHSSITISSTQVLIFNASDAAADSATFTVAWGTQ
jgi:hypothetical protein